MKESKWPLEVSSERVGGHQTLIDPKPSIYQQLYQFLKK
jgi:hypothetical protein